MISMMREPEKEIALSVVFFFCKIWFHMNLFTIYGGIGILRK